MATIPRPDDTFRPFDGTITSGSDFQSLLDGLTGPDRDIAVALQSLFASYGLDTLAPRIIDFIKQGYSADTVSILLQQTDEYKQRFIGNRARLRAGVPALSPAEYLATESAYRQVMRASGLPSGFYDTPQDFADLIGKDVSPTEVQDRVQAASSLVNNAPPEALAMFKQFYSTGDIIAYALDANRAAPLVEKRIKAAEIAGFGQQAGVGLDVNTAERLAGTGVSGAQAEGTFGFIAGETANAEKLGAIFGDSISQQDLVQEAFFNDAGATKKRAKLASRERAAFSGSSGLTSQSLSRGNAGAF